MIEKIYAMKMALLKKKIVPSKVFLKKADWDELRFEVGMVLEWVLGLEIHLSSTTYVE